MIVYSFKLGNKFDDKFIGTMGRNLQWDWGRDKKGFPRIKQNSLIELELTSPFSKTQPIGPSSRKGPKTSPVCILTCIDQWSTNCKGDISLFYLISETWSALTSSASSSAASQKMTVGFWGSNNFSSAIIRFKARRTWIKKKKNL